MALPLTMLRDAVGGMRMVFGIICRNLSVFNHLDHSYAQRGPSQTLSYMTRRQKCFLVRAQDDEDISVEGDPPPLSSESSSDSPDTPSPEDQKGQATAIVTGAISIILGVGYLLLVQFLDSRELLPPPPEAFM